LGFFGRKPTQKNGESSGVGYVITSLVSDGHREKDIIEDYSIGKLEMYMKHTSARRLERIRSDVISAFYGARAESKDVQNYLRELDMNSKEILLEE